MTRYAAFISYSHSDAKIARWLHHAIETYRLPKALVGSPSPFGPVPRRLPRLFRDRDELPASGDLGQELRSALADSRFQIVLCSPKSAASKWVNEEILSFKRVHGEHRTLALIASGEPYAGGDLECFPPALRFRLGPDGQLSDEPAEPIAADIRPGKDGRRLALLKLIAGITGLQLDALVRRDAARRQRRMVMITAASLTIALVTIGLAIYAETQRRYAERQRLLADRSLEFLIGTFSIANPATENPRTITALSILDRVSKRAATELRGEPAVSARLLQTTGEIYSNLGLPKESERDLKAALALEPARSEVRARSLLKLAMLAYKRGDAPATLARIDEATHAYEPGDRHAPELDAMAAEWRAMAQLIDGQYAAAADGLAIAAEKYEALPGDHRTDLGRVWMARGEMLVRIGQFARAEPLYARATAAYRARYGDNHVLTATTLHNQGWANFEAGRFAPAEQLIGRAVQIYDRVLEGDHPTIGSALILMGRIRTARGDAKGALAALDKARGIYVRLYGADNAAVGDSDFYAADALSRGGDVAGALKRLASTKTIYDANYGPDDPDQVELLLLRSRILARAGRLAEARHDCSAGIALEAKLDPEDAALAANRQACATIGQSAPR